MKVEKDLIFNINSFINLNNRGIFISFEGGDGSGKTTQLELLANFLNSNNVKTVSTFEPGGTELGQTLRNLIQHSPIRLNAKTEALLFAADRSFHVDSIIKPTLEDGLVILTDRYIDSSVAYQGAARELGTDEIEELSLWATNGLLPDVTIYLDVDETVFLKRVKDDKKDKIELAGSEFRVMVREQYLESVKGNNRYCFIDGSEDIEKVFKNILVLLNDKIKELNTIS